MSLRLLPPLTPKPFEIGGPLPAGFTVLEASAGTGKTYSLAGLVARFVAEDGLDPSQLCVVSFTEAATAELRGRIRSRLADTLAHLVRGAPADAEADDEVLAVIAADPAERWVRRERLERALADFDAATISTIHGFCSRVVSTGSGIDLPISADDSDVDELVADHVLARYGATGEWPAEPGKVADAVRLRLRLPDAHMFTIDRVAVPALSGEQAERADDMAEIAALVEDVVAAVLERRAAARRRTFDGLITDARELLAGPTGPAVRAALQARFRLVMIDEFQDTDQVQWDIFRAAFLEGDRPSTVVVVGDPKQSIYRFRSAELSAYLDARLRADSVTSLATNRRSDAPLLAGLETLFAGYEFGDPDVEFVSVAAAPGHEGSRLPELGAAVQIRCLDDELVTGEARARARDDMVAEVVRLLEGTVLDDPDAADGGRPLRASDIGVLVRSNADATRYVAALAAAGVPAASSSNDSVIDSPAANEWRILLAALERPSSPARARAAGLGWFVGMTAAELDAIGDDGLGDLAEQLRGWALALVEGGLARLMSQVRATGLLERVLRRPGGERDLTDLDHVQELLQSVVGGRPVGAPALLGILDDLADPDLTDEEALAPELLSRRIDRDDDTVKVLTVHRAKGLEFPVVLCPTLWTARPKRQGLPHAHTDGGAGHRHQLHAPPEAGAGGKRFADIAERDKLERAGEDSRLLYVALTRAKHRLVLWWSPAAVTKSTLPPLGELFAHAGGGELDLPALAARSKDTIDVVEVGPPGPAPMLTPTTAAPVPLDVAVAERALDDRWRIWSFSAVKAAADATLEEARLAGSPVGVADAPSMGGVDEPSAEASGSWPTPRRWSPVRTPSLRCRPRRPAPPSAPWSTPCSNWSTSPPPTSSTSSATSSDDLLAHRRLPTSGAELAPGLLDALRTPLGGPMGDRPLVELTRADRLDELSFDLPLAAFRADQLAAVVARHLPADDPLASWFERAAVEGLAVDVDGLLTGSIDLVGRTADGRYWLADYKTNLLSDGDYGPDALAEAMAHHGYPLQATLYLVALHRYLRWRLRDYDPDRDLSGAAYLFLRGMHPGRVDPAGSATPGIVWWRPPTAAILELDQLLATGRAA